MSALPPDRRSLHRCLPASAMFVRGRTNFRDKFTITCFSAPDKLTITYLSAGRSRPTSLQIFLYRAWVITFPWATSIFFVFAGSPFLLRCSREPQGKPQKNCGRENPETPCHHVFFTSPVEIRTYGPSGRKDHQTTTPLEGFGSCKWLLFVEGPYLFVLLCKKGKPNSARKGAQVCPTRDPVFFCDVWVGPWCVGGSHSTLAKRQPDSARSSADTSQNRRPHLFLREPVSGWFEGSQRETNRCGGVLY